MLHQQDELAALARQSRSSNHDLDRLFLIEQSKSAEVKIWRSQNLEKSKSGEVNFSRARCPTGLVAAETPSITIFIYGQQIRYDRTSKEFHGVRTYHEK